MDNPYVRLTNEFNDGRLRAILASGQAVVLYRLAIMSKDGDWTCFTSQREPDPGIADAAVHAGADDELEALGVRLDVGALYSNPLVPGRP